MQIFLAVGIRAIGWTATALKALQRGEQALAIDMMTTGMMSGLLPVFGLLWCSTSYVKRWRRYLVFLANFLQYYYVGKKYRLLYPCTGDCTEGSVSLRKALTATASGNGTAFLILTTFMGSITFRWLFLAQYIYFLILVVSNRSICAQSPALRRAYTWMHSTLLEPIVGSIFTSMWPESFSVEAAGAPVVTASETVASDAAVLESSIQTCVRFQLFFQLIAGLWIPCWLAYVRELAARRLFLRSHVGPAAERTAMFPSSWEMFVYATPALAFPWVFSALSGAHLEVPASVLQ